MKKTDIIFNIAIFMLTIILLFFIFTNGRYIITKISLESSKCLWKYIYHYEIIIFDQFYQFIHAIFN